MNTAFSKPGLISILSIGLLLAGCATTAPLISTDTRSKHTAPTRVSVALDIRHHSEWTSSRREKAQAAARIVETIFNSAAFTNRLAAQHDLQRSEGLSGTDILHIIRSGQTLTDLRGSDKAMHKAITLALSISPDTIEYSRHDGFTDLDTGIIYARKDWLDDGAICLLAGLLAHEYMHVIGFSHTTFNHPWRRLSVPYAVGDLVTELAAASLGKQCATPSTKKIPRTQASNSGSGRSY